MPPLIATTSPEATAAAAAATSPFAAATPAAAGAASASASARLRLADLSPQQRWSEGDTKGTGLASLVAPSHDAVTPLGYHCGSVGEKLPGWSITGGPGGSCSGAHGSGSRGGGGVPGAAKAEEHESTGGDVTSAATLKAVTGHRSKAVAHRYTPYAQHGLQRRVGGGGWVGEKGKGSSSAMMSPSESSLGGGHSRHDGGSETSLEHRSGALSAGHRTALMQAMETLRLQGKGHGSGTSSSGKKKKQQQEQKLPLQDQKQEGKKKKPENQYGSPAYPTVEAVALALANSSNVRGGAFSNSGRYITAASDRSLPVKPTTDSVSLQGGGNCKLKLFGATVSVLPPPFPAAAICLSPVAVTESR